MNNNDGIEIRVLQMMAFPVAILLMIVSMYFSMCLYEHFATSAIQKFFYQLAAVLVPLSMAILWICGHYYWETHRTQSMFAFSCWFVLVCVSICSTIGSLEVSTTKNQRDADKEKQTFLTDQIRKLDAEIGQLTALETYYAKKSLIDTGIKSTQAALVEIRINRDALTTQVNRHFSEQAIDEMFVNIARALGVSRPERVRFWLFFFISMSIDMSQLLLFKYSFDIGVFGSAAQEVIEP